MPVPNVEDPITTTAKMMGYGNVEMVFYEAARAAKFSNAEEVAKHRYETWRRSGYHPLPDYIKNFCVMKLNKLTATEFLERGL